MAFPSLVNSYNVVVSAPINFLSDSRQDATFHRIAYDNSSADWDSLHDHLRDVPCEDTFKLSAPAAASKFCESVQVGIDTYVPHGKYQIKPYSSPWFPAAYAAAIVHRNQFFHLYKQNKYYECKEKFRQASNLAKGFLKLPNLHMLTKQKSLSLPRNLALWTFGELPIVFSTKVNPL